MKSAEKGCVLDGKICMIWELLVCYFDVFRRGQFVMAKCMIARPTAAHGRTCAVPSAHQASSILLTVTPT
eukprot:6207157-Pleurochrysis_carterae.AAC.2